MKVVFFGTPQFSAYALDYLLSAGINVVGVVSKPDKPKGRSRDPVPTPVKELLQSKYPLIPFWQPEKVSDGSILSHLQALDADFFVVVAYGEIIKESLLQMPKVASINLHTSLLPKYRGAAPIQRAIMDGESESGVSIMYMAKKMDAGDIISLSVVPIGPEMTYGELEEALLQQGLPDLLKALNDLQAGTASRVVQDEALVTFAPKVELENCEILWNRPAQQLHDLIRGTNPEPGSWCWISVKGEKKRLKVFQSRIVDMKGLPGEILGWGPQGWIVGCQEGALELIEIQLEGKKRMQAKEQMRGLDRTSLIL